jgi:hypothetical protein
MRLSEITHSLGDFRRSSRVKGLLGRQDVYRRAASFAPLLSALKTYHQTAQATRGVHLRPTVSAVRAPT